MGMTEFDPSKLGTRAHWDDVYEREVANFEETGDEGEIWFGEDSIEKMVDWTLENVPIPSEPRILEIGSGNGTLLFALRDAGYAAPHLSGIDYSPDAVRLALMIAQTRQDSEQIAFHVCDFLSELPPPPTATSGGQTLDVGLGRSWDLLLDKGTYDAIALGEKDGSGNSPVAAYPVRASKLLRDNGYLLITSCNFTEEELKASFVNPETNFRFHSRVKHPSISFGGQSGSVYTTVAFMKEIPG
ncbi:S-adenosyl-L-methionine-dependent methyltransferase [Russula vinacea]|nr:S-adenosyl-L-methionine-dependent methyltransferase [Russula vinacea]